MDRRVTTVLFLVATCLACGGVSAEEINVTMRPYKARAFRDGGEVWFTAEVELPSVGEHRINIHEVMTNTDFQTLRVTFSDDSGVDIHQVAFFSEAKEDPHPESITKGDDARWAAYLCDLERDAKHKQVTNSKHVLEHITTLSVPNTTIDNLLERLEVAEARLATLVAELAALKRRCVSLQQAANELDANLTQAASRHNVGQLVVGAKKAGVVTLNATLSTSALRWRPVYKLWTSVQKGNRTEVDIEYSAVVMQTTEVTWNDVEVELSTGQKYNSQAAPVARPVKLGVAEGSTVGGAKEKQRTTFPFSSNANSFDVMQERSQNFHQANGILFNSAAAAAEARTPPIDQDARVSLTIPHRHVLRHGVEHRLKIGDIKGLDALIERVAVPKLDNQVYLRLRLNNTSPLTLSPGEAQATIDGDAMAGHLQIPFIAPLGKGRIDVGVDQSLSVRRTSNLGHKTDKDGGFFSGDGSKVKQVRVTNRIINRRSEAAIVHLVEMLPLALHDSISITVVHPKARGSPSVFTPGSDLTFSDSNVKLNANTGALTWSVRVEPQSTVDVPFAYDVKIAPESPHDLPDLE